MRRVRFSVAMSLDGYIAGPNGESDWIVMDPEIDFGALMSAFDTIILGRKTYEATRQQGGGGGMPGVEVYVFSRTLRPEDCPGVTVSATPAETLAASRWSTLCCEPLTQRGGSARRTLHGRTGTATDRRDPGLRLCVRERPCPSVSSSTLVANAALSLLNLCCHLLDRQLEAQARAFEDEGGFTERLYRIRQQKRKR
jgi:four helix bundle suffix protein